jgi:hypothetical protein
VRTEIKVEEQPAASVAEDDESSHRLKRSQLEAVGALLAALSNMQSFTLLIILSFFFWEMLENAVL